jgi:hypothetical protein
VLYEVHGSRGRSIDFIELLYDKCVDVEVLGSKKKDLELFFMGPELVELSQTNHYIYIYILL